MIEVNPLLDIVAAIGDNSTVTAPSAPPEPAAGPFLERLPDSANPGFTPKMVAGIEPRQPYG